MYQILFSYMWQNLKEALQAGLWWAENSAEKAGCDLRWHWLPEMDIVL